MCIPLRQAVARLRTQRRRWNHIPGMKEAWHPRRPLPPASPLVSLRTCALLRLAPFFVLIENYALLSRPLLLAFQRKASLVYCPLYRAMMPTLLTAVQRQARSWRPLMGAFLLKLRYKGKSFRWYRKGGGLLLKFGASHLVALRFPFFAKVKKSGKIKFLFFGSSLCRLRALLHKICAWRPMNIYNARGLRFAKQRVMRKHGKVSAFR